MIIKKGFTLIELLIVIAILSILSTIGVTNFQSARIKARDVARKSDLQVISKSLEAYVNDHASYPLSNSNGKIICKTGSVICDWGAEFSDDNDTIYGATLPADQSGFSYWYTSGDGSFYTLYTHLENDNDPAIANPPFSPAVYCGGTTICNYKINSSNIQ